ncbi:MAG TPA: efflux RND transporter periplasmic adaptor subunit [Acetobacteraceae bacterium]|nr:efflux RND transporter periplasmic adaptor subunit [Acetobacteraceae bacterium]
MDRRLRRSSLDPVTARRVLLAASVLAWTGAAAAPDPADPAVPVVHPTTAHITRYLETTGTVAAMQSVDLVARISGTLEAIQVADGAIVKKGTTLFVIEPLPYESKLRQMQAAEDQQRAVVVQADTEYARQAELRITSASSQSQVDSALATRDSARAALKQAEEATKQAAITYTYTRVTAPFDGVVTARLVSVGELVGSGAPTKLATILQLDPIWVNANISEADVLRGRAAMAATGKTIRDLGTVPVEAAIAGESGYPHRGALDYVAPMVDPTTGTLAVRGRFDNPGYVLLPGYFVKLRIPVATDAQVLLLPFDAISSDQGTPTVFVVGADGSVKQQPVQLGGSHAGMQVIESGLTAEDQVIASAGSALVGPGARVRAVQAANQLPAPAKP